MPSRRCRSCSNATTVWGSLAHVGASVWTASALACTMTAAVLAGAVGRVDAILQRRRHGAAAKK